MKIKPEHYAYMLAACKEAVERVIPRTCYLSRNPLVPNIDKAKDPDKRYRWDLMYAAGVSQYICDNVYKYADDTHIDTALKQIVKELRL